MKTKICCEEAQQKEERYILIDHFNPDGEQLGNVIERIAIAMAKRR